MPRVTVLRSDVAFDALVGQSVYDAAWAAGYYWPNSCNAAGTCLDCLMHVEDGSAVSPSEDREQRLLEYLASTDEDVDAARSRLACQARILGDVTVEKVGVRPAAAVFPGRNLSGA